ncbi:MAG TPA: hypothetical protein VGD84_07960, partial [Pseudonocardiaceae bacterium]
MTSVFLPGIELARRCYGEVVAPILETALSGVPYSAALIGTGSEVQSFDSVRSTDHGWGPRMQVFLDSADFHTHAEQLDARLDRELPAEFHGYPYRFARPDDAPVRHHVDVHDLRAFFTGGLGADPDTGLSALDWLMVPTQVLRE